jgi:pimeloyl-ACP methyl ester carboxylesterase
MQTERFKIKIPDTVVPDLNRRLKNTRWPDEIPGSDWDYGTNLAYLKQLVDYWQHEYDWQKQEAVLNTFSHYKTEIDDVGIHFIHERGKGPNPLPIILTHGFPDSFLRFLKIIPMLTDPETYGGDPEDAFHVVVPSLPGFGFSDEPKKAGTIFHINDLWADLMKNGLGYQRFGAHGGDWGGIVTEQLARSHAELLVGIHLTDIPFTHIFQKPGDLSAAEEKYLAANQKWQEAEGAYAMIQSTRPETLAAGLNDSPVGLAAWVIEKFQSMSDCDGKLENCFTKDELITNIMIYWATETISTSMLPYYDIMNAGAITWIGEKIKEWTGSTKVPAGFCMFYNDHSHRFFQQDNSHPPREWAERFFNVQHWTRKSKGGHFAAMEQPEILVQDIRNFFRPLRVENAA